MQWILNIQNFNEIIHSLSSTGSGNLQLSGNGIDDDRKHDTLLCFCDEAAIMIPSSEISNNEFTYKDAKDLLESTCMGTNYKRTFTSKFRLLHICKGMKINQFWSEL